MENLSLNNKHNFAAKKPIPYLQYIPNINIKDKSKRFNCRRTTFFSWCNRVCLSNVACYILFQMFFHAVFVTVNSELTLKTFDVVPNQHNLKITGEIKQLNHSYPMQMKMPFVDTPNSPRVFSLNLKPHKQIVQLNNKELVDHNKQFFDSVLKSNLFRKLRDVSDIDKNKSHRINDTNKKQNQLSLNLSNIQTVEQSFSEVHSQTPMRNKDDKDIINDPTLFIDYTNNLQKERLILAHIPSGLRDQENDETNQHAFHYPDTILKHHNGTTYYPTIHEHSQHSKQATTDNHHKQHSHLLTQLFNKSLVVPSSLHPIKTQNNITTNDQEKLKDTLSSKHSIEPNFFPNFVIHFNENLRFPSYSMHRVLYNQATFCLRFLNPLIKHQQQNKILFKLTFDSKDDHVYFSGINIGTPETLSFDVLAISKYSNGCTNSLTLHHEQGLWVEIIRNQHTSSESLFQFNDLSHHKQITSFRSFLLKTSRISKDNTPSSLSNLLFIPNYQYRSLEPSIGKPSLVPFTQPYEDNMSHPLIETIECFTKKSRTFRQYLIHADFNLKETHLTFWSVIIRFSLNKGPDVRWRTLKRERLIYFAPRRSLIDILERAKFTHLGSLCYQFLLHDLDVGTILQGFPFKSPNNVQVPAGLVGEGFITIYPSIVVLFRFTNALRSLALRDRTWILLALRTFINSRPLQPETVIPFTTPDWTRAITGQEQATYLLLASNFLRGALQEFAALKRLQKQRIPRFSRTSKQLVISEKEQQLNSFSSVPVDCSSPDFVVDAVNKDYFFDDAKPFKNISFDDKDQQHTMQQDTTDLNRDIHSTVHDQQTKAKNTTIQQDVNTSLLKKPENHTDISQPRHCHSKHVKNIGPTTPFNGILEITETALRLAFPTHTIPPDCPLVPIQLVGAYLPKHHFPPLRVFATSLNHRGTETALAVLVKTFCSKHTNSEGICFFPCLPTNWKSRCSIGQPIGFGSDHTIVLEGNWLAPVATFCDKKNPIAIKSRAVRRDCAAAGLSIDSSYNDRLHIQQCLQIQGTGDFPKCSKIIHKYLLNSQIPAPQESSSFGSTTPTEVGKFLQPTDKMFILGQPIVQPILFFKQYFKDLVRKKKCFRGDFEKLQFAATKYCKMKIQHHTVDNQHALDLQHFDFCFKTSYTYRILRDLGIEESGPPIYFKNKFQSNHLSSSGIDKEYTWERGSILHTIMKENFISDLYYLKADVWRTMLRDPICAISLKEDSTYSPLPSLQLPIKSTL